MMALVPMLAEHLGVKDQELLEKDVRLHALLASLVRDPTFGPIWPSRAARASSSATSITLGSARTWTSLGLRGPARRAAAMAPRGSAVGFDRHNVSWKRGSRIGPSARDTSQRTHDSSATVGATA